MAANTDATTDVGSIRQALRLAGARLTLLEDGETLKPVPLVKGQTLRLSPTLVDAMRANKGELVRAESGLDAHWRVLGVLEDAGRQNSMAYADAFDRCLTLLGHYEKADDQALAYREGSDGMSAEKGEGERK